jgi:type IV pilus assembly protein PilV
MVDSSSVSTQHGATMIEVLVTMIILVFGLLGLAGLQARLQVSEMESYQRAQALILLEDMANRIMTNRSAAAGYVTGSPLGAGMTCPTATSTLQNVDAKEWCEALQGAAETTGASKVGAMIGARGCVESGVANEYLVTVAWQGLTPISAPPASVACGKDSYNGGACTNDRCRRAITTVVRIGTL